MIRKEAYVSPAVLGELKRILADSEILREDDKNWPAPDRVGRQELEVVIGNEHISFTTNKIGSLADVQASTDAEDKTFNHVGEKQRIRVSSNPHGCFTHEAACAR